MSPVSKAPNQGTADGGLTLMSSTNDNRRVSNGDAGLVDRFLKKCLALIADFRVEPLRLLDPTGDLCL